MRRYILILFVAVMFCGCSKKNSNDVKTQSTDPGKSILLFPSQNSACTTAAATSTTQSDVTFTWQAAANTDSYDITTKNLLTGAVSTQTITTAQVTITLARSTPYAWFVVSKSSKSKTTAQSDTWKFYNPGPGAIHYAPFQADGLAPEQSQNVAAVNGKVDLSWKGSDPDNDIAGYDIYFGTSSTAPALAKSDVKDMFLKGNTVASGTTYYWKIVTKDAQGNTSDTGIYQFTVK